MRCVNSASLSTGAERKAQLNIWNVTPAEAMLTPRNSRFSPPTRLAAITRKDSRRFSATFSKFILAPELGQATENTVPNRGGDAVVEMVVGEMMEVVALAQCAQPAAAGFVGVDLQMQRLIKK